MGDGKLFGLRDNLSKVATAMVAIVNIAFFSLILAFSAPYWLEGKLHDDDVEEWSSLHSGLWRTCVTTTKYVDDTDDTICYPTEDYVEDAWSDGWVIGVQALMIVALIMGIFMELASNAYVFMPSLDQNHPVVFVAMCLAFTTGALSFVVFMIYALRHSSDSQLDGARLSWAFGFGVVASFFCLTAWVFLLAESMHVVGSLRAPDRTNALHNTAERRTRVVPSATVPNEEPMGATGGYDPGPIPADLLPPPYRDPYDEAYRGGNDPYKAPYEAYRGGNDPYEAPYEAYRGGNDPREAETKLY